MKTSNILKVAMIIVTSFLTLSCSKKKVYVGDGGDLSIEKIKADIEKDKIEEETKMKEEAAAKLAEEEAKKQAMLAEEARIENEKREKQLAMEREEARKQDLANRVEAQKQAFKDFRGTEFDELHLLNGKVLVGVKVSKATPIKVTFLHKDGVANVKYKDLPTEIREACKFDEELKQIELDRINAGGTE